jgi:hypothetical protein
MTLQRGLFFTTKDTKVLTKFTKVFLKIFVFFVHLVVCLFNTVVLVDTLRFIHPTFIFKTRDANNSFKFSGNIDSSHIVYYGNETIKSVFFMTIAELPVDI